MSGQLVKPSGISLKVTENYLQQIRDMFYMSDKMFELCLRITKELYITNFLGNQNPRSVSAAIVYICAVRCGISITQWGIHDLTGVHPQTIRKNYLKIKAHFEKKEKNEYAFAEMIDIFFEVIP